jgi:hypothetical protein
MYHGIHHNHINLQDEYPLVSLSLCLFHTLMGVGSNWLWLDVCVRGWFWWGLDYFDEASQKFQMIKWVCQKVPILDVVVWLCPVYILEAKFKSAIGFSNSVYVGLTRRVKQCFETSILCFSMRYQAGTGKKMYWKVIVTTCTKYTNCIFNIGTDIVTGLLKRFCSSHEHCSNFVSWGDGWSCRCHKTRNFIERFF